MLHLNMDQGYITHQRRPALIPSDSCLSAEDEQSVRIRTGCALFPLLQTLTSVAQKESSSSTLSSGRQPRVEPPGNANKPSIYRTMNLNGKRKASTTAEEYQEIICTDDTDEEVLSTRFDQHVAACDTPHQSPLRESDVKLTQLHSQRTHSNAMPLASTVESIV